jgi:hypothetical protein
MVDGNIDAKVVAQPYLLTFDALAIEFRIDDRVLDPNIFDQIPRRLPRCAVFHGQI